MNSFESIIIATTFHEPEFRLKGLIESCLSFITENKLKIIISHTSGTNKEVISYLRDNGFILTQPSVDDRVLTYIRSIEVAIDHITDEENQRIFYIDFDRLLHWINNYPDELIKVLMKCNQYELLHIGRNQRAFETHPITQQNTERIVNQLGSRILGLSTTRDLISVSYSFTKSLAEELYPHPYTTKLGFYASWPVILWSYAKKIEYLEVDGQEWESPDRFQKEIKDLGYEKWIEQFQTAEEWRFRVNLLEDCIFELTQFLKL